MTPHRGLALRSTALVVAILALVLVGLYYLFIDPYSSRLIQFRVNDMLSAASVPGDIADATYLLTPANGAGLYRNGTLGYEEYAKDGSFVLDIAYVADKEVELLFIPSSRLYVVRADGKDIFSSRNQLLNLFVSEDGTRVSVSARNENTIFEAEPIGWNVVVIDVASGTTWKEEGFASVFLGTDRILAFRADGISVVTYETGEDRVVKELPTSLVYPSIAQSKDGSKVAWTTLYGELYVYDVLGDSEISLAQLKETKTEQTRSRVALTDENVYEVALRDDGRTDILRHALFSDETSRVRSLPSLLSTNKLIP